MASNRDSGQGANRCDQVGRNSGSTGPISAWPQLGPASERMLAEAGIDDIAALRALGAVPAYARVKGVCPRASLNLLWALEAALTGLSWQQVAREHRTSLLLALEEHLRRRARPD